MKKLSKSLLINFFLLLLFAQVSFGQTKVDTSDVILTAAEQFINWKGYDDKLNDTTRLLKSAIAKFNRSLDSIFVTLQKPGKVVYSQEVIDNYKNNLFSLAALAKLIDPANPQNDQVTKDAFMAYIDKNNTSSLLERYSEKSDSKQVFLQKFYEVNKGRNLGTGWNTSDPSSLPAMERALQFIAPASGKSVIVKCGSGHVFYDGHYGGPSGVELILFRGPHVIVVKENNVPKCKYELLIPQEDIAPIVITCSHPATPCKCQ